MSVEPDIVAAEPPAASEEPPLPRPWIAAVLTWCVPGLGQAYAGAILDARSRRKPRACHHNTAATAACSGQ